MMMMVRPEVVRNRHLLRVSLNKPVPNVNPPGGSKNRLAELVFRILQRLTFWSCSANFVLYLVEVRIPSVAGRAFRSASDARAKGESAVDPPKSLRQLKPCAAGGQG